MRKNHNIATFDVELIHQTDKAWLVSPTVAGTNKDGTKKQVWVPKSLGEYDEETGEMQLPEDIAIEKGLV